MKPHILWGFIWIQIVCKGHQWSSKITASRLRVKHSIVNGKNIKCHSMHNLNNFRLFSLIFWPYHKINSIICLGTVFSWLPWQHSSSTVFLGFHGNNHTGLALGIMVELGHISIAWKKTRVFSRHHTHRSPVVTYHKIPINAPGTLLFFHL